MSTLVDKKKNNPRSLVERISRTYTSAMLLINAVMLLAFIYINLSYLYSNTLVDMGRRVAMQFQDSMISQDVEDAFRDSRTNIFQRQLDDLNKYSRPEKVRLYVVFPNGVTGQVDDQTGKVDFKLLPPHLFGVFNKAIVTDEISTERPNFHNHFQYWITGVPIHSHNGFTGGMVITTIYIRDVLKQLMPTLVLGVICVVLSLVLLHAAQRSFYLILHTPLENITNTLENWSLNSFAKQKATDRPDEIGRLSKALEEVAERLSEEKEKQEQDEENRRNFFFNVSHELRTPVTSMRAQVELLKDGLAAPEEVPAYYDGILQEAKHIQEMVEDLLTLSRLQAPGYTMEKETCCISEIMNDVYIGMAKVASERKIFLTMQQQLAPEKTLVEGNYTRIRQMLLIFLENALKYSESGTHTQMLLQEEQGEMVLQIRDEGCGIPTEEIDKVFQFQYRASNSVAREGTGLGLSIAQEIANQMDFRIVIESKVNTGTIIRVYMPRVEE